MAYHFSYDLTELEKRLVRVLVDRGLAKYGVACCVEARELLLAMGEPAVTVDDLASLMENLAGREVDEVRDGVSKSFRLFDSVMPQGAYPDSARWTYKFSRQFLKFRIGRSL